MVWLTVANNDVQQNNRMVGFVPAYTNRNPKESIRKKNVILKKTRLQLLQTCKEEGNLFCLSPQKEVLLFTSRSLAIGSLIASNSSIIKREEIGVHNTK